MDRCSTRNVTTWFFLPGRVEPLGRHRLLRLWFHRSPQCSDDFSFSLITANERAGDGPEAWSFGLLAIAKMDKVTKSSQADSKAEDLLPTAVKGEIIFCKRHPQAGNMLLGIVHLKEIYRTVSFIKSSSPQERSHLFWVKLRAPNCYWGLAPNWSLQNIITTSYKSYLTSNKLSLNF